MLQRDSAVGGAAGVIHESEGIHTDCEPNTNVEGLRLALFDEGIKSPPAVELYSSVSAFGTNGH